MNWARHAVGWLARLPVALAATYAMAEPAPTVHWLVIDFPPYEIHSGPDAGQGLMDRYLQSVIQRLPQFRHDIDVVGFQRRDALMKMPLPSCTVSRFSTPERARYAVFAQRPFMYLLPPRLVAVHAAAGPVRSNLEHDAVPLVELLYGGHFVLGVYPARHFGEAIDHQLDAVRVGNPAAIRDYRETGSASIIDLLNILAQGGFDMTLAYTVEGEYLRRARPSLPALAYFPIAGATGLLPLHVSCNKTALGQAVLQAVDQLDLREPAAQAQHDLEALLPPDEKRRYEALLAGMK